ncbi:MAG TPA: leucyl/phenylalanyl-tRNA--protein transferase [Arenimonas sp.]|nr:leucyl/phenylalanyl-tRNA--protein transferase [Arenimonas sp.]
MPKNSSTKSIDLDEPLPVAFPDPELALLEPNGLLASGGALSPDWLLSAYRQGIFPWYNPGEAILWWSPDPRFGFAPAEMRLSRSRLRQIRRQAWIIRADTCFEQVIRQCAAAPRAGQPGTWITDDMIDAYTALHRLGFGHSVEVFEDGELVGGLYGLAIGQMFFAESMFSLRSQASAFALYALGSQLARWNWPWIDAQVENPHLKLLGGRSMPRGEFIQLTARQTRKPARAGSWSTDFPGLELADYQGMNAD